MAQVVEPTTSLSSRASRYLLRSITPLLVVGVIVALSACGGPSLANNEGGSGCLGAQDVVGSAAAGQCIQANFPYTTPTGPAFAHSYFCGPYAKQWCKNHPGEVPLAGSCDGVPGRTAPASSNSGGSRGGGSGTGGGSGSQPSTKTECTPNAAGCDYLGHKIICDPVEPRYPCFDNTTGALRTAGSNSTSSGSGSRGSSSAGTGGPSGGTPSGPSGSQNGGSSNSGSPNGSSGSQNGRSSNDGT